MRKIVMLLFVMMVFSVLAVPAFAQTGAGAAGSTNWVAITSGFAIAIASGLAAQGQGRAAAAAGVRGGGPGACRVGGVRGARTQSGRPRGHSGGADSWPRLHRVAGVVRAGNY